MTGFEHGEGEGRYVRERILEFFGERDFQLILESSQAAMGWQAEFIGRKADDDLVCLVHKPIGAPYASLTLVAQLADFDADAGWRKLLAIVSDYDVSCFFANEDDGILHFSSRIHVAALNRDDFSFHLNNLMFCRGSVLGELSGEPEQDEAP